MTLALAFIIAICAAICAVFFTRVLFFNMKMALIVGGIITGGFMYWGVLGVIAGFDTSLEGVVGVTAAYWLYSCIVWVPVYFGMVWVLSRSSGAAGSADRPETVDRN